MLDETDMKILKLLMQNSRMKWQDIGEEVHLTGQAVRNRITKLEKLEVIEGYTIRVNDSKLGKELIAFITVFMKNTEHKEFQKFINDNAMICEGYRISGDGCYLLKVAAASRLEIVDLLDKILQYGNYKVNFSIGNIK